MCDGVRPAFGRPARKGEVRRAQVGPRVAVRTAALEGSRDTGYMRKSEHAGGGKPHAACGLGWAGDLAPPKLKGNARVGLGTLTLG